MDADAAEVLDGGADPRRLSMIQRSPARLYLLMRSTEVSQLYEYGHQRVNEPITCVRRVSAAEAAIASHQHLMQGRRQRFVLRGF